ncbi:hypothetical protein [Methylorubrum suomiense]|uniref:Uncharacterized protein n=1 Tax=Methylorubrum suomiense TaxID=144191 RepID=A0ABQ4UQ54_9HYPH|nr:hypothetical protein [Methylorubrum suomiense]GJE74325.1 hypothetical protein BGCPKDLD_0894 [Methylorubrum suomiense]
MKGILAAIARALSALGRVTLVPVIEGGRLVWRAVRSALAPHDPIAEAEAAFEAEAAEPAPAAPPTFDALPVSEQWGLAAAEHLYPSVDSEIPPGILDRAAAAYLDGLSPKERASLIAHEPRYIGEHLLGERVLQGLPKPLSPSEFAAMEGQKAAAAAEAARAEMEKNGWIRAIFDDVLDEGPPAFPA